MCDLAGEGDTVTEPILHTQKAKDDRLFQAIQVGELYRVEQALDQGANPNVHEHHSSKTPLSLATELEY
jgi:hypothetical protein